MGIFSSIKNRLMRRNDDYDDIKSHVLDEPFPPPAPPPAAQQYDERFGPPLQQETFPREPDFPESERPLTLEREEFAPPSRDFGKEYDIADKLNLIEAQLSAIRSQTETINERLKNMEARLVRRY